MAYTSQGIIFEAGGDTYALEKEAGSWVVRWVDGHHFDRLPRSTCTRKNRTGKEYLQFTRRKLPGEGRKVLCVPARAVKEWEVLYGKAEG